MAPAVMHRTMAEPFVPESAAVVIGRVRSPELNAAAKEIRELERRVAAAPERLPAALNLARRRIEAGRDEGDPRHLGRAQAVLEPWLLRTNPPMEALFLRATIRQGLHDFDGALADLKTVLEENPAHTGAWLTRAMIQCLRADFAGARTSAAHLIRSGDELVAMTAAANVAALTGDSANAMRRLEATLNRHANAPAAVRAWSWTLLAETAARRGEAGRSDGLFRAALALAPRDPYLLGAYADFLLDQQRAPEAAGLLANFRSVDSLLLRYAEASPRDRGDAVEALTARIEINRARRERIHLREEARVCLRLLNRPPEALALARENWTRQKEPADARLLLEAARAAHEMTTERELMDFLKAQGLEDISLGLPVRSH